MLADLLPDRISAHLAQAHVRAADGGDGPRGTPAVAVEHRQRPQVDAVLVVPGVHDLGEGVQVGAPVRVDHALREAGGAGGVVERDGSELVRDRPRQLAPRGPGDQVGVGHQPGLIGRLGDGRPGFAVGGHDQLFQRAGFARRGQRGGQQPLVGDEDLRARVAQDVGDLLGGEPGVNGDEHRARQRDREMGDQHLGQVGHQVGDPVAGLDAAGPQRAGSPRRLGRELGVGEAPATVDHGDLVGPHASRAIQEGQRCHCRVGNVAHLSTSWDEPASSKCIHNPRRFACCDKRGESPVAWGRPARAGPNRPASH